MWTTFTKPRVSFGFVGNGMALTRPFLSEPLRSQKRLPWTHQSTQQSTPPATARRGHELPMGLRKMDHLRREDGVAVGRFIKVCSATCMNPKPECCAVKILNSALVSPCQKRTLEPEPPSRPLLPVAQTAFSANMNAQSSARQRCSAVLSCLLTNL